MLTKNKEIIMKINTTDTEINSSLDKVAYDRLMNVFLVTPK